MIGHQRDTPFSDLAPRRSRFEVPRRSQRGQRAPWFDVDDRRCVYALVARVARADGVITDASIAFLRSLRAKLGLTRRLAQDVERPDEVMLRDLPRPLRYLTLQLSIAAATVDDEVVPAARDLVEAMADQLGLSKRFVNMRLTRALSCPKARRRDEPLLSLCDV